MLIKHNSDIQFYVKLDKDYRRFVLLNHLDYSFSMINYRAIELANELDTFVNHFNDPIFMYPFADIVTLYVFRLNNKFDFRVSKRMGIFNCTLTIEEMSNLISAIKGESHANQS